MKKFLSLVLAAIMVLSMVSVATAESYNFDITVWVDEKIVELTKSQIAAFNENNGQGITFNATVEPVSEANSATNMITDVTAGGDLYVFAQDQFARLVEAGALAALDELSAADVTAANAAGVVKAAMSGDVMYAYPMTADNGYFMYYDKSVVKPESIDSLEAIIADCEAAKKYFAFEMNTSAWYAASFFFGTGCVSEWTTDADGKFISVNDTFNSKEGLVAVKGMKKLVDSPFHLSSSSGAEFSNGAAVVVTGIWDYTTVEGILGENMGVADLPSFEVDGVSYHIGSYNGCKLMGVKPQEDPVKAIALHMLATYLTNEECQLARFEEVAWGPSNLKAMESEAVKANPGLVALNAQAPYSVPQGQIHGSWWDIAKVIADDVKAATDDAGLQTALDNYYDKIAALFNLSDEVLNAWTVIGTVNGTNWDTDLAMTHGADGIWRSAAYAMTAGVEFKVRQGLSWDNNFPADNFKVEADGTYIVEFDEATGTVTLVAQ